MHSKKTVLFAALLGLSLFVLGLAVGQGWFAPQQAKAQDKSSVYTGPEIAYFDFDGGPKILDVDGYWWDWSLTAGGTWHRQPQILAPGTPIPAGASSMGGLKGGYGSGN